MQFGGAHGGGRRQAACGGHARNIKAPVISSSNTAAADQMKAQAARLPRT
jgi:hypothetical protein